MNCTTVHLVRFRLLPTAETSCKLKRTESRNILIHLAIQTSSYYTCNQMQHHTVGVHDIAQSGSRNYAVVPPREKLGEEMTYMTNLVSSMQINIRCRQGSSVFVR